MFTCEQCDTGSIDDLDDMICDDCARAVVTTSKENVMDYNEIATHIERYRKQYPSQRMGQAYFNAVAEVRPDIADAVQGTIRDPFYDDEALPEFCTYVAENV